MALSLRAWVNKHISAINEVRPLNHQVFCDSLRDTTAFDSFLGALDAEGDGEQWITTKNGHHVLIDGEGTVKAGFGGKYAGQNIKEAHGEPKKAPSGGTSKSRSEKIKRVTNIDKLDSALKSNGKKLTKEESDNIAEMEKMLDYYTEEHNKIWSYAHQAVERNDKSDYDSKMKWLQSLEAEESRVKENSKKYVDSLVDKYSGGAKKSKQ